MMYCVQEGCDGETSVVETIGSIRRRRCKLCHKTFYTEEVEYIRPKASKSLYATKWDKRKNPA